MSRSLRSMDWTTAGPQNPAQLATPANALISGSDASGLHVSFVTEFSASTYQGGRRVTPITIISIFGNSNGTEEVLAAPSRQNNRGGISAKSRIEVLTQPLVQLPNDFYGVQGNRFAEKNPFHTDSGGYSGESFVGAAFVGASVLCRVIIADV